MWNKAKIILIGIFVMALAGIYSCGGDAPPVVQPKAKKMKIANQNNKPAGKRATAKTAAESSPGSSAAMIDPKSTADDKKPVSELIKESMAMVGGYDPKGRFDPFEPLFKDDQEAAVSTGKRKKRLPQTPLERVALSQLKLSAIMRTSKGNSAVVEDATGKGYIIRKGTYIGLNSGQVLRVDRDGIVIEEEFEDVSGEIKIRNTELKLQKPAGEL